jgi:hypothetical protein
MFLYIVKFPISAMNSNTELMKILNRGNFTKITDLYLLKLNVK